MYQVYQLVYILSLLQPSLIVSTYFPSQVTHVAIAPLSHFLLTTF